MPLVLAVLALAVPRGVSAQTATLDLEDRACSGPGVNGVNGPYTASGYVLTPYRPDGQSLGAFGLVCTGNAAFSGSTSFYNIFGDGSAVLSQVGGGAFSLNSIDLAPYYAFTGSASQLTFFGTTSGGTVSQTFSIPAVPGGIDGQFLPTVWATYSFGPQFGNVTAVQWQNSFPFHHFDNISVGTPTSTVPEPATMTLLATGLAGMAAARRKKKQLA